MQNKSLENFLSNYKLLISIIFILIISILIFFRTAFFESTLIIKNLGNLSIEPEIAFSNKKPIFLEFYADWCEVCKKMAPNIVELEKEFENEINFVFLNVDNPKWDRYIKEFNVNGIPQINIFDSEANLNKTFVGLQNDMDIEEALRKLSSDNKLFENKISSNFSELKKIKNYNYSPRSHGL